MKPRAVETICDCLKIGFLIVGMGQSSMRELILLSATKCDRWLNFVRKVESIQHAKKDISAPILIEIDSFQGNCHKCGNTDTLPQSVGVRAKEGQRSVNVRSVGKDIMESVRHKVSHHPTEIHRREDGKMMKKEMAREHRRVANPKVETKGKAGKGKERKERTTSHQWQFVPHPYS